jgi:hypothetical protein
LSYGTEANLPLKVVVQEMFYFYLSVSELGDTFWCELDKEKDGPMIS